MSWPGWIDERVRVSAWFAVCLAVGVGLGVQDIQAEENVVFSDDFNRPDVTMAAEADAVKLGRGWGLRSDPDSAGKRGGASLRSGMLWLGGAFGQSGATRTFAFQDASTWPGYSVILADNPGKITWTFNLRTGQVNPTPVSLSGGTTAVAVLASGNLDDFQFKGPCYYIMHGLATDKDPLQLVKCVHGVRNQDDRRVLISAGPPFHDLGNEFLSVRATYDPSTHQWTLEARKDGGGRFQPPHEGAMTLLGTVQDSEHVRVPMRYIGFVSNSNNGANGPLDEVVFDNLRVTVSGGPVSYATRTFPDPASRSFLLANAAVKIQRLRMTEQVR